MFLDSDNWDLFHMTEEMKNANMETETVKGNEKKEK